MLTRNATSISSLYLQVLVGGDLAALKGIMKHVLDAESAGAVPSLRATVLDRDFIAEHTSGFDEFAEDLRRESWDVIEAQSGLSREQLEAGGRHLSERRTR